MRANFGPDPQQLPPQGFSLFLDLGSKVSLVAELHNKVDVVCCLFDIDHLNVIVIFARFDDFTFIIQQLVDIS